MRHFTGVLYGYANLATGYASQDIWCLSQARINREGCARKGMWHKMVGMAEVGATISVDGWQSIRIVGVSAFVYVHCAPIKSRRWGECFFWYWLTRVVPDKFHTAVKRLCVCPLQRDTELAEPNAMEPVVHQ